MQNRKDCPVCAGTNISQCYSGEPVRREWRSEGTFKVFSCKDCAHRFLNPLPDDAVLARCYSSQYHAYEAGHGTGDLQKAIETARREKRYRHVDLSEDTDVLDVGCGSGSFLHVIRDSVSSIYGIEPSQYGVDCCHRLSVPVFHGDFETYNETSDRKFDLITLNHVLEHHPEPLRLIDLCRRHLKTVGRIWIAVPNAGCFFARTLKSEWHSSDLPVHLQHFSVQSLSLAIENSGLKIASLDTESENSLPASAGKFLRRYGIPNRFSRPFLNEALSKGGWIGRRIDASGNGEAILASATA